MTSYIQLVLEAPLPSTAKRGDRDLTLAVDMTSSILSLKRQRGSIADLKIAKKPAHFS